MIGVEGRAHIINKNGATDWFEMCFAPSTVCAGGKTRLESSIKQFTRFCFYDWPAPTDFRSTEKKRLVRAQAL